VILEFAVIGQGTSGDLPATQPPAERESCQPQRVDVSPVLKNVEYLLYSFIHKRDSSHLNSHDLLIQRRSGSGDFRAAQSYGSQTCGDAFYKIPAFHARRLRQWFFHPLPPFLIPGWAGPRLLP